MTLRFLRIRLNRIKWRHAVLKLREQERSEAVRLADEVLP